MCGIAGIVKHGGEAPDAKLLGRMTALLRHRGPDDCGAYTSGPVGLAHARLSIIDLKSGDQPMANRDGSLWITFNGEIFNYLELRAQLQQRGQRFATNSDTEVILQMYETEGEDCVRHFNGQWAFAIWDSRRERLFLSRDRMGTRPLFYSQTPQRFIFGSEIKSLFVWPDVARELDLIALDQIFTFWVTLGERTAFRNIHQLPPGHSMIVENGRVRTWQYWTPNYTPEDQAGDALVQRKTEELLDLLRDATRLRLRSDVPVGAYLSGGIDSTVIAALASSMNNGRLNTFSVRFEDPEFDESHYQRRAADFLDTEHREVRCTYQTIADAFPQIIWHTEQPILRTAPAPLYALSGLVHDSGIRVVLTGEGADEVLGGYDIFKEAKIRRFWGANPDSRFRPLLLKRLYPYMQNLQNQPSAYLKEFFRVSTAELADPFFSHLPRWDLTTRLKLFLSGPVRREISDYSGQGEFREMLPHQFANWSSFSKAEYLETVSLLPGYILSSQGDRMAMAHSVEGRYPFLDHRIVEFAAQLPAPLKMKVLKQKYLLQRASRDLIPGEIVRRPKQPYRAPDAKSFFCPEEPGYVRDMLSPEKIRRDGIFSAPAVAALVSKVGSGKAIGTKDNMALVGILSTQLLLENFVNNFRPEGPALCTRSTRSYAISS